MDEPGHAVRDSALRDLVVHEYWPNAEQIGRYLPAFRPLLREGPIRARGEALVSALARYLERRARCPTCGRI
jgi:hypothetical protein